MSTDPPRSAQADAMIRRVSPEGRARAQKERERRQRATTRLVGRMALAALAIGLAFAALDLAVPLGAASMIAALLVFAAACVAIGVFSRERPATLVALPTSSLAQLPEWTEAWLERQRPALPAPTVPLLDSLSRRLGDMTPQLAALDANAPAAAAVRRLLATDLPALVGGYLEVPPGLRATTGDNGRSADAHLLEGLTLIDGEVGRMTGQLARGAFDELATQSRFLELKYDCAGDLA